MKLSQIKGLFVPGRETAAENLMQLKANWKAALFGRPCPLCGFKTQMSFKERSYLPFKVCAGCSYDIHLLERGLKSNSRNLAKLLAITGMSFEEFQKRERVEPPRQ